MIRWGLVGAGAIAAKRVGPALVNARASRLVAVYDTNAPAAAQLCRSLGAGQVVASFEALLASPEVDAVYLATPVHLHAPQAVQALRTGKHVLVEKPMALTVVEAEDMVRAARQAGQTLATAYYRRFYPKTERVRQLIADGTLGQVTMITSVYHTWYDAALDAPGSWRTRKATAGGGVVWDMGAHRFDLLIGLFGTPARVWAATATLSHNYDVEDTATVWLQWPNGCHAVSTWQWNSQTWLDHLSIIGSHGKVILEPMDSPHLTLFIGQGRSQERFDETWPLPDNVHLPVVQDFVDSVMQGRDPVEVGEEGLKTNRILAAVDAAAASGCRVELRRAL